VGETILQGGVDCRGEVVGEAEEGVDGIEGLGIVVREVGVVSRTWNSGTRRVVLSWNEFSVKLI